MGVVLLRDIQLVAFLSEINGLKLWATDIGCLPSSNYPEKLVIIAGSEFKELEGHVLVIQKALYGLRSSGLRWHQRFAQVLKELGFKPCEGTPDVWL